MAVCDAVWRAFPEDRSEAAALNVVAGEPGVNIKALALILELSHSAAVRVVDRLEVKRLLERRSTGPGRVVSLHATRLGRQRVREAAAIRAQVLTRALSGFSTEQRDTLMGMLTEVVGNLEGDQTLLDRACRLCDQNACVKRGCPLPVATA